MFLWSLDFLISLTHKPRPRVHKLQQSTQDCGADDAWHGFNKLPYETIYQHNLAVAVRD